MVFAKDKTIIIIVGPTAAGKTSVAIELAKHFKTEIISADSRQCFKELNIGVARPSEKELQAIKHHFIATHSIHDNVNAGTFEQYALQKARQLFQAHDVIIMTGGTGLYIKAFTEGMDEIPDVPSEIRNEIISGYGKNGLQWLQKEVQLKDPQYYEAGEIQNPQRLMRALEVTQATGKSILEFHKGNKEERDFNIIRIGLELSKEELRRHIDSRVDRMIEEGLIDEAKKLLPHRHLNALRTVGYSEIFDYLDDKISLEKATELIKEHTRQYAKRQMTWFKKDKQISWYAPGETEKIIRDIHNALP